MQAFIIEYGTEIMVWGGLPAIALVMHSIWIVPTLIIWAVTRPHRNSR